MNAWLRIIGDLHRSRAVYRAMLFQCEYSIQIGDFDFSYDWLEEGSIPVNVKRHRFLTGNHDNMDTAPQSPYYLGDYGVHAIPEFGDIFYVRGAFSVDYRRRREFSCGKGHPKNWWANEQLSVPELTKALELYESVKPDFVISHECPVDVVKYVTDPMLLHNLGFKEGTVITNTNTALQAMHDVHKPKVHCFGHYHRHFDQVIDGTRYICIPIDACVDFSKEFLHAQDSASNDGECSYYTVVEDRWSAKDTGGSGGFAF